jgi:hypothetical protein
MAAGRTAVAGEALASIAGWARRRLPPRAAPELKGQAPAAGQT